MRLAQTVARLAREMGMLVPLWLLLLACLVPKVSRGTDRERYEFFPFSHFPMYSDFDERDYYVFVTGRDDQAIATESLAAIRSTRLKKILNTELSRLQKEFGIRKDQLTAGQCRPGGDYTLDWLVHNAPASAQEALRRVAPLRLYRVYITEEDGKLVETAPQLVGEWSPGALPPSAP